MIRTKPHYKFFFSAFVNQYFHANSFFLLVLLLKRNISHFVHLLAPINIQKVANALNDK